MGQDLQIALVLLTRFARALELFQAQGEVVNGNRVVIFVIQGFAIAAFGGRVVFLFEVEIADLNVLGGFVRVPRMRVGGFGTALIQQNFRALGMCLGVVGRRSQINLSGFTGTLSVVG